MHVYKLVSSSRMELREWGIIGKDSSFILIKDIINNFTE